MERRVWIAVALALPLAGLGWAAKVAASWRPVKIADIGAVAATEVMANERYVVVDGPDVIFDLRTGKRRSFNDWEGVVPQGAWRWQVQAGKELILRDGDNPAVAYPAPKVGAVKYVVMSGRPVAVTSELTLETIRVRVSTAANRVEMVASQRYYRWNKTTRALTLNVELDDAWGETQALARDGEAVVNAGSDAIYRLSTRASREEEEILLPATSARQTAPRVSPQGSYAIYAAQKFSGISGRRIWKVIDTATGAQKWRLDPMPPLDIAVFSPDETLLAVPGAKAKIWEIHALPTGKRLRTLPLAPSVTAGAFSPGNQTLYSVASGTLYRQRAQ